jgi:UDP-glucose 4-epimerase
MIARSAIIPLTNSSVLHEPCLGEGISQVLFIQRALHWYEKPYGLRWVALHYFNAAGASEQLGECRDPETYLIPLTINAALTGIPLSAFGTDYPTEDGTAVRDYMHVDILPALTSYSGVSAKARSTPRFQSGHWPTTLGSRSAGNGGASQRNTCTPSGAERRPGDPPVLVVDSREAKELLSWTPQRSSFREIVESAWLWHSKTHKMKTRATL